MRLPSKDTSSNIFTSPIKNREIIEKKIKTLREVAEFNNTGNEKVCMPLKKSA